MSCICCAPLICAHVPQTACASCIYAHVIAYMRDVPLRAWMRARHVRAWPIMTPWKWREVLLRMIMNDVRACDLRACAPWLSQTACASSIYAHMHDVPLRAWMRAHHVRAWPIMTPWKWREVLLRSSALQRSMQIIMIYYFLRPCYQPLHAITVNDLPKQTACASGTDAHMRDFARHAMV